MFHIYIYMHTFIYYIIINPHFSKQHGISQGSWKPRLWGPLASRHLPRHMSLQWSRSRNLQSLPRRRRRRCLEWIEFGHAWLIFMHLLYNMNKIHRRDRCIYIIQDPAKVQKTCGGLYGAEATDSQLTVPGVSWLPSMSMQTEWQNNEISGCISLFACM